MDILWAYRKMLQVFWIKVNKGRRNTSMQSSQSNCEPCLNPRYENKWLCTFHGELEKLDWPWKGKWGMGLARWFWGPSEKLDSRATLRGRATCGNCEKCLGWRIRTMEWSWINLGRSDQLEGLSLSIWPTSYKIHKISKASHLNIPPISYHSIHSDGTKMEDYIGLLE